MNFAQTYIAQLERFAEHAPLPKVRALHLPPASVMPMAGDRGEFCALELEDGSLGLSYILLDDTLQRLRVRDGGLGVAGTDALGLARGYANATGVARTLGFAAANALTRCFFDRAAYQPETSADSIGQLDPHPGERIGMIGLFTPLVDRILKAGADLTVVELQSALAGDRGAYRVSLDPAELADCCKILSTSTLLLNDTLDRMLGFCRQARWFAMIGPSAGCLPDALFARGVTLVGGSWVLDREGFLEALSSGHSRSDYARKFVIAANGWPGFDALLRRV